MSHSPLAIAGGLDVSVGIRFTPDGRRLLIAENNNRRISLFTVDGTFVRSRCAKAGVLAGPRDVEIAPNGELLVANYASHQVLALTPEGDPSTDEGVRVIGETIPLASPRALAVHGGKLFVLNECAQTVHVFV